MGMNKVQLHGHLGRDPELKMTPSGSPLCKFSLATTETWKDAQGNKQSKTEWHQCIAWNGVAERAEKFLKKGKEIILEGKIQYRDYIKQVDDGHGGKIDVKISGIASIVVINFEFCGSSKDSNNNNNRPADPDGPEGYTGGNSNNDNSDAPNGSSSSSNYDDDIPF